MGSDQIFKVIWLYVFNNAEMLHKFKHNFSPDLVDLCLSICFLLFCEFQLVIVNHLFEMVPGNSDYNQGHFRADATVLQQVYGKVKDIIILGTIEILGVNKLMYIFNLRV